MLLVAEQNEVRVEEIEHEHGARRSARADRFEQRHDVAMVGQVHREDREGLGIDLLERSDRCAQLLLEVVRNPTSVRDRPGVRFEPGNDARLLHPVDAEIRQRYESAPSLLHLSATAEVVMQVMAETIHQVRIDTHHPKVGAGALESTPECRLSRSSPSQGGNL